MLIAYTATTTIFLGLGLMLAFVYLAIMIIFAAVFRLWMQAFMSGTPVRVVELIGMRLRRTDAKAVVKSLIMAKQAGVTLSRRQVEKAYVQGVDLERLTLAMIRAQKQGMEVTFEELVEADLEDRLAEKLGLEAGARSGKTPAEPNRPLTGETENRTVRICQKCARRVSDDSKICRNCGAIL